jgi:hypothetical protein
MFLKVLHNGHDILLLVLDGQLLWRYPFLQTWHPFLFFLSVGDFALAVPHMIWLACVGLRS